jgi:NADH-quinone oxidoreductase subunit G
MSEVMVTLSIDGKSVTVEKGTLLVDAAKRVGVEIPVFCYHPKLHSVGMCRMCLVEVGRPAWDRGSEEAILDENGEPVIKFGPTLETACTLRVDDGWIVNVNSEKAVKGRREVVEFLLTSHPLDCPICDKGGECPLQDLTMEHGSGKSRFLVEDKSHAKKHVALGDLIFLDRERCIQCARCVRFQEEIVDDPVLGFSERGRNLEIVTFSTPGFDSYFSGNTTDICPVGALTTADFRFGARPWELNAAASICPHCPVGCNIVLNTRREAKAGGGEVVKRVMPRQNESINEIWICDKGRFAYHYALSEDRLSKPLVRRDGELQPASWDEALTIAADGLKAAGNEIAGIAGGRASNEDLFNFRKFFGGVGGKAYLHDFTAGGFLVQQIGVGTGTNLGELGQGDVIVVVSSDLLEEAPIWWLRVKQAVERGSSLIVINARTTRLDKYASISLRYDFGSADGLMVGILSSLSKEVKLSGWKPSKIEKAAVTAIQEAENLIIFFGSEGVDHDSSLSLVQSCASILVATDHVGKPNNGLIPVWRQNNTQGAWDMGLDPLSNDAREDIRTAKAVYVLAADPVGDLAADISEGAFLIVQELFQTETVNRADVVFPARSFLEREGTYTSGERVVQRFYPAVASFGEGLPDWKIIARLGEKLGIDLVGTTAAEVMNAIAGDIVDYSEISYQALLNSELQWPHVGDDDNYFGGTAYKNDQGLGIHLKSAVERGETFNLVWTTPEEQDQVEGILIVPITRLLDGATTVRPSQLLHPRIASSHLWMNPEDLTNLGLEDGAGVDLSWNGQVYKIQAMGEATVPSGTALVPRSLGVPLHTPTRGKVTPATG